jgi:hypothetical protein
MATRSLISKANEDGTIQAIYCHHDGYPEHVGKLLVVNYNQLNLDKLFAEPKDLRGLDIPSKEPDVLQVSSNIAQYPFRSLYELKNKAIGMYCEYLYYFQNGIWNCMDLNEDCMFDLYEMKKIENV